MHRRNTNRIHEIGCCDRQQLTCFKPFRCLLRIPDGLTCHPDATHTWLCPVTRRDLHAGANTGLTCCASKEEQGSHQVEAALQPVVRGFPATRRARP